MQRILKGLIIGLAMIVALVALAATYVMLALPKVKAADAALKIEATPARLARGEYLAHNVSDCYSCHSQRDWSRFGAPVVQGSEFGGGEKVFDERIGLPGRFYPRNLTPYSLGRYSDGELVRVLRTGVTKEGQPLFPMMPYQNYRHLTQEDLYSLVAYLRTLKPVANDVPAHKPAGPFALILRTIPGEAPPYPAEPDRRDPVAYGQYLVNAASCSDCHTPKDAHGQPLPGLFMAGGFEFPYLDIDDPALPALASGRIRTANLTPDAETGLGRLTKAQFIARFADWRGKAGEAKVKKIKKGDFNTLMPWLYYSGMTDEDLGAIYEYLRTVPPVKRAVQVFEAPRL